MKEMDVPNFLPELCHSVLVSVPRILLTHPKKKRTNTEKARTTFFLHAPAHLAPDCNKP